MEMVVLGGKEALTNIFRGKVTHFVWNRVALKF